MKGEYCRLIYSLVFMYWLAPQKTSDRPLKVKVMFEKEPNGGLEYITVRVGPQLIQLKFVSIVRPQLY